MPDLRAALHRVVGPIIKKKRQLTVCPNCKNIAYYWSPNPEYVLKCPICNTRVQPVETVE